ncbi:MAG TPA: hypothetical protein PK950_00225 [Candidatus Paceibacterota bacterium]|nr:hypothetical protein [Candidatus Paceibacterota bacterium]
MIKKIFIAILILLLLGAGIAAYFYFFSNKTDETGQPTFSLSDIFPFGDNGIGPKENPTDEPTNPDGETPNTPSEPTTTPRLQMVNRGPIAGAHVYDTTREIPPANHEIVGVDGKPLPIETEPATKVRYVETATGHISETYLDALDIKKITSTTIPKIAEAYFGNKEGTSALLRYADEKNNIQTFAGTIPTLDKKDGTPDTNLIGSYLPENIMTMAVSPDAQKILTIVKNENGSVGSISLPNGTKKSQLFSLAYSEWLSQWPNAKFVTITTKASAKVPGYMYTIDTTTKSMKKVIGGVLGLTTLTSPDMKNILFSRSGSSTVTSSIYSTTGKTALPLPGATTLPEKCIWQSNTILYCAVPTFIPNGDYPDVWYQGGISFVDQIYKINITDYSATVIGSPSEVDAIIDAINLSVDPSNTFLIFTNKRDGSLWSLDLRPDSERVKPTAAPTE